MTEFKKICNDYEKLGPAERAVLLAEVSVRVTAELKALESPELHPLKTLATFIIGAIVSDGALDEKQYLFMYPSLVKTFGEDFDFATIKATYKTCKNVRKALDAQTKELVSIISACSEDIQADIVTLCLLITSYDGKITLKEKRYIRRLCK